VLKQILERKFCGEQTCAVFSKLSGERACDVLLEWTLEKTHAIFGMDRNIIPQSMHDTLVLVYFTTLYWSLLGFTDAVLY
jgi:predicted glycosyltransferase